MQLGIVLVSIGIIALYVSADTFKVDTGRLVSSALCTALVV